MKRELLEQAISFIGKQEGLSLKAYLCPAGIPTIGYGDTAYVKQFDKPLIVEITHQQANDLLAKHITDDYNFLAKCLSECSYTISALSDNQIVALLSLVYNIGQTQFYYGSNYRTAQRSGVLTAFFRGGQAVEVFKAVSNNILAWKYSGGKPILLARRQREVALFNKLS